MGYTRKSYIFIFGTVQTLCFLALCFVQILNSLLVITLILTLSSISYTWILTVTNALICVESRKDSETGS